MRFGLKYILFVTVFFSLIYASKGYSAGKSRVLKEFVMSSTYGVLAGSLVGVASLAFTDSPGNSLNNVARGASLGLYAGIALGIYITYIVPNRIRNQEMTPPPLMEGDPELEMRDPASEGGEAYENEYPEGQYPESGSIEEGGGFLITPTLDNQGKLDGVYAQVRLLSF